MKSAMTAVLLVVSVFCWGCVSSPDEPESEDVADAPELSEQGVGGLVLRDTNPPDGWVCSDINGDGVYYCTDPSDPESPALPFHPAQPEP